MVGSFMQTGRKFFLALAGGSHRRSADSGQRPVCAAYGYYPTPPPENNYFSFITLRGKRRRNRIITKQLFADIRK
jgi:hypothetical protein